MLEQIYITTVVHAEALPSGLVPNKKGGATIAVKKRGGWKDSWMIAQKAAGWLD